MKVFWCSRKENFVNELKFLIKRSEEISDFIVDLKEEQQDRINNPKR